VVISAGTFQVPVGTAFPGYVRVLTGPFNIAGTLCLVFGAIYSAYIFMPKHRLMRVSTDIPVLSQLVRGLAVGVNFLGSIPGAMLGGFALGLLETFGSGLLPMHEALEMVDVGGVALLGAAARNCAGVR